MKLISVNTTKDGDTYHLSPTLEGETKSKDEIKYLNFILTEFGSTESVTVVPTFLLNFLISYATEISEDIREKYPESFMGGDLQKFEEFFNNLCVEQIDIKNIKD